jgi:hypothetical protein
VYGPQIDAEKIEFQEELRGIRNRCQGPWFVVGDKNNDNINRAMMDRFRRLVNELDLKEITMVGQRYTWSCEEITNY